MKTHLAASFWSGFAVFSKGKTALQAFLQRDGVAVGDHLLGQRLVGFPLGVILVPLLEQFSGLLVSIHPSLPHLKSIVVQILLSGL